MPSWAWATDPRPWSGSNFNPACCGTFLLAPSSSVLCMKDMSGGFNTTQDLSHLPFSPKPFSMLVRCGVGGTWTFCLG